MSEPEILSNGRVWAWTKGVEFEESARKQVENLASLPFLHKHVAIMPDVHWGMGATVGSVIPTVGAIVPAAVGVDIGCGMNALRTSLRAEDLPSDLGPLRAAIEKAVPHGRTDNGGANDRGTWNQPPESVMKLWSTMEEKYNRLCESHKAIQTKKSPIHQLGTLGTGNHFIEICLDESGMVWFVLHSGSRGAGNRIGTYFISEAKKDMERWFISLPDADLAYIPEGSPNFQAYVEAVTWAQEYAFINRIVMMDAVDAAVRSIIPSTFFISDEAINCHHNYISQEHHFGKDVWLTRKGAVSAKVGQLGIIPGSMGARTYIVEGKGNRNSFESCSHGAGRVMSRTEARRRFTLADHATATAGIECRKDVDVIDETPGAYKSIDAVMEAQRDLVSVRHELRQVICVKG